MKHNPSHTEIVFKILYVGGTSEAISTMLMEFILAQLVLGFAALVTFGEESELLLSAFCSFLQTPVTTSLLRASILLRILFPNIVDLFPF